MNRDRDSELATAGFLALLAFAVAGALVAVRDDLDNANVALILMAIVVVAAMLGGRLAGITVAVVSSLSFNFFHTRPYQSLRINRGNDVLTVCLLFVSGLVVGEVANRRRRTKEVAHSRGVKVERLNDIARQVLDARPLKEVWDAVRRALIEALDATEVWFEPADTVSVAGALPEVGRNGVVGGRVYHWVGTGFALPKEGVQMRVGRESSPHGRVVLRSKAQRAVDLDDRFFALTLMDLLALAITQSPHESLAHLAPMPGPPDAVKHI